jgi:hypothetical protein
MTDPERIAWELHGRAQAAAIKLLCGEKVAGGDGNTYVVRAPSIDQVTDALIDFAALSPFAAAGDWAMAPRDDLSREVADSALPGEMIEAGVVALEQVDEDHRNYVPGETADWDYGMVAVAVYRAMLAAAPPAPAEDEYMTVTLSRDGAVTSHNAYDADFDEMVAATEKIIDELQKRLSNRKYCPFSHGAVRRNDASPPAPVGEDALREARRICAQARPDYADGFLSGKYDQTSTEMRAVLIALAKAPAAPGKGE